MFFLPILLAFANPSCDDRLQQAVLALRQNNLSKASSVLEAAQLHCSQSARYFGLVGVTNELSGNGQIAEEAFLRAIGLDANSASLHQQLGSAYLRNGKPEKAADQLKLALTIDPQNTSAKKYLIGAHVELRQWQNAADLFNQIGGIGSDFHDPILVLWFAQTILETKQIDRIDRELSPQRSRMNPTLLFSLGTLFAQQGLYPKAVEYLQSIPAASADDATYFNLALAYSHLEEIDEARKNYFMAIEKNAVHADAYFHVGVDYGSAGQGRMAVPWLLRSSQLAPARPDIAYVLAEQLIDLGYYETAKDVIAGALETNPNNLLLKSARGNLEQAQGDLAAATKEYRDILATNAGFVPALTGLARSQSDSGKDDASILTLRSALLLAPHDLSITRNLGLIEARLGDDNSAVDHLKLAWTHNKMDEPAALALSRVYRHLTQPAESLRVLTAVTRNPQDFQAVHLELAQVYRQLGKMVEAQAEQEQVARIQVQLQDVLRYESPKVYVH